MPVHFDQAQIETGLRDMAKRSLETALARQTTTEGRQMIEAQYALTEATIIQSKVFADLLGNDVPLGVIVAAMGSHTGSIVATMLGQVEPEGVDPLLSLFITQLMNAVSSFTGKSGNTIALTGIRGGQA